MNQIISSYIEERRLLEMPGFVRDELDYAIRYTPIEQNAFGIICFTRASGENIDEFIEEQVSFIEQKNLDFEWKVYDFDQPSDLRKKLLEKGFEEGDTEAFMVYDLSRFRVENLDRSRFENVRRIDDPAGLREVIKFQETISNVSLPWILNYLRTIDVAVFGMYEEKSLIGTGWIEYPKNSEYADIHGGAVHPDFRGKSNYTTLLQVRFEHALSHGYKYVTVDAAPMSRPILRKKGFQHLCWTYPLMKRRHQKEAQLA